MSFWVGHYRHFGGRLSSERCLLASLGEAFSTNRCFGPQGPARRKPRRAILPEASAVSAGLHLGDQSYQLLCKSGRSSLTNQSGKATSIVRRSDGELTTTPTSINLLS